MDEFGEKLWLQGELEELKNKYNTYGCDRESLKEAFNLCITMDIPLPEWVIDGIDRLFGVPTLNKRLATLEQAFKNENLGALKDAVYECRYHRQHLPEWANLGLFKVITALAHDDKKQLQNWSAWFRRYKQDITDYEFYDWVLDARDHGATWNDVYEIVTGIRANKPQVDRDDGQDAIEKAYKRVVKRLKENPYRYTPLRTFQKRIDPKPHNSNLWQWIEDTIKTGKPKRKKKQ